MNIFIYDSWFGFVYEIAFIISDIFYKYFILNWAVIGVLVGIYALVAFMSIIVRGITIGSSMGSEGYTQFMDRMFSSDIATKIFVGAAIFGVTVIPINFTVHYSANKLIPTKVINVVFNEFTKDMNIDSGQGINIQNPYTSSGDTFSNTESTQVEHHVPLILAVPIFLFDTIFFGTDGKSGLLPAIFGEIFEEYELDPESIPKKYLQYYFNKDIYDEIQNRLLNGALDMNLWYTKVIPDTLTAFGFGQDNEKVKIYEGGSGADGATLNTKAALQKLNYLMLKGYNQAFDKFDSIIDKTNNTINTDILVSLDEDDALRNIMKHEFTHKDLSSSEIEQLGQTRGNIFKSVKSASEYAPINTKQTLLDQITLSEENKKVMSAALAIVEYPMVLMSGISAQYAKMDLTYDTSRGLFSNPLATIADPLDTLNIYGQTISEGVRVGAAKLTDDFFATTNVDNVKCLTDTEVDNTKVQDCINKQLGMSNYKNSENSLFTYIDRYAWNHDNSDKWFSEDTEDIIHQYYTFLDSFLSNGTVDKSTFNFIPKNGPVLVDALLKKFENYDGQGRNLYDELNRRREIIFNGIQTLQKTSMGDAADFSEELAQLQALLKFYDSFIQSVRTILLKYEDYKINSYGTIQSYLTSNMEDLDEGTMQDYKDALNNIPAKIEENVKESDAMQYEQIVPELFNWLSSDQGGGLMSMLKDTALMIARGLMLFFTLLFLILSIFMFLQFFLMRSIHGFVFLVLWPVHVFKVILTSDISKFKVLFKDWLTFRGYDLVLIIALILTNMFIECSKVLYLYGLNVITDANIQSIYGNVMISLFAFVTYQALRLLYQQFCKIIEQSDSVFAQSIGRISDSMTAGAGVFSSVAMGAMALSKQLGGTLAQGAMAVSRLRGGGDVISKMPSGPDKENIFDSQNKR